MNLPEAHRNNIDVWNLRGHAVPLDRLANKLIRRAQGKHYVAVIIDPIYKVIIGDENSAADMARFCNVFDTIAQRINCATVYAHHHSKGTQGQKRAIDRASGSGVFGRDPDAVLDFIELQVDKTRRGVAETAAQRRAFADYFKTHNLDPAALELDTGPNDNGLLMAVQLAHPDHSDALTAASLEAADRARHASGWRIEGTLREFATPPAIRVWFDYPIHRLDDEDLLKDAKADGEEPQWMEQHKAKEQIRERKKAAQVAELTDAIHAAGGPGVARVADLADSTGVSKKTVYDRIQKLKNFHISDGVIHPGKAKS
jgi:hypothetical protein